MIALNVLLLAVLAFGPQTIQAHIRNRKHSSSLCIDRTEGELIPDPKSCSLYYMCHRGRAVRQSCGRGLYFDDETLQCNLAALVDCINNGQRLPGISKPTTDDDQNAGNSGGSSGSGDADCTTQPTTCSTQSTTKTTTTKTTTTKTTTTKTTTTKTTTCPTTTTTACPETTTTTCPGTTTTTCPGTTTTTCSTKTTTCPPIESTTPEPSGRRVRQLSSDCLTLDDGTFLVDENHCRRYYVCEQGKTKRRKCKSGQWFDYELQTCVNRRDVTNCPAQRN